MESIDSNSGPGVFRRFVLPLLFIVALFVALFTRQPEPVTDADLHVWQIEGSIFGTTYRVKVLPSKAPKISRDTLASTIQNELDRIDLLMSTYKEESELSLFNQNQSTHAIKVSEGLCVVLKEALRIGSLTKGAFDITVGPVVNLWGFGPNKNLTEPTEEALKAARSKVGIKKVHLNPQKCTLTKKLPDLYLDLSAIAKGYAVDSVGLLVEQNGFPNYLAEVGGELRARGLNLKGSSWKVGVEKPQSALNQDIALVVPLVDQSMATSGNYRNFYKRADGRKVSHSIDGRTGEPVEHPFSSVTVLHPDCMTADALATGLFALGVDEGLALANKQNLAVLFLIPEGDTFKASASQSFPDFKQR